MNWFKKAQAFNPISLEDRNLINEKIRYFEDLDEKICRLAKVVFQDGKFAKDASYTLANDKKLSSHPKICEILIEADRIALDSPWKFADLCISASDQLRIRIGQLKKQRKQLIEETMPQRMKGWVDKHAKE